MIDVSVKSSLLEDDEYTEKFIFKIPHFKNKYQDLEDNGLLRELIKMEIGAFTISYSKQKTKMKKGYEEDLIKEVSRLENLLENCPSSEAVQKYIKVIRTNWIRFPTTGQGALVCAPKLVGMSLANEVRNIFLILRDEITKRNALPAL